MILLDSFRSKIACIRALVKAKEELITYVGPWLHQTSSPSAHGPEQNSTPRGRPMPLAGCAEHGQMCWHPLFWVADSIVLEFQFVLFFNDIAYIGTFPVRLDPAQALISPLRWRAAPVTAHHEPLHQALHLFFSVELL